DGGPGSELAASSESQGSANKSISVMAARHSTGGGYGAAAWSRARPAGGRAHPRGGRAKSPAGAEREMTAQVREPMHRRLGWSSQAHSLGDPVPCTGRSLATSNATGTG